MDTKAWGPPLHRGLMFIAAGYDLNDTPRDVKNAQYIAFFRSIGDVLPCRFCRESYKQFFDELGIESYLYQPCGLMRFYYDLRNKISDKLKTQEDRVAVERYRGVDAATLNDDVALAKHLRQLSRVFYTQDTPPFDQVVQEYMKYKAKCSTALKTCRANVIEHPEPQSRFSNGTDTLLYSRNGGKKQRKRTTLRQRRRRVTKKRTRSRSTRSRSVRRER